MTSLVRVLASGLLVTLLVVLYLIWSFVNNIELQERRRAVHLASPGKGDDESGDLLELVIAVLSARAHDKQRRTVRETWAKDVPSATGVRLDFVLGESCAVPPQLRLDPLSCEEMPDATRGNKQDTPAHEAVDLIFSPRTLDGCRLITSPEPLGIDFELFADAVITHLGVYDHGADGLHGTLSVHIFDSVSGKMIVRQSFSPDDKLERRGMFLYKPVTNFAFPKGFLGSAVAQDFSEEDAAVDLSVVSCASHLRQRSKASRVMKLLPKSRRGGMFGALPLMVENVMQTRPRYLAASFVIDRHPDSKPPVKAEQRSQLRILHKKTLADTEDSLRVEHVKYSDVVTVGAVDTYRNLPLKLLLYFEWLTKNTRFKYLLKTDDDCLLNVSAVLGALHSAGRLSRAWWGRFRREWSVERFGKWRELDYSGNVYPPFACGAGHALSEDLVMWLAENRHHLKVHQGEDVSLGIWLGAVGAQLWDDERWYCSRDSYRAGGNRTDYLAIPNLSTEEMRRLQKRHATEK